MNNECTKASPVSLINGLLKTICQVTLPYWLNKLFLLGDALSLRTPYNECAEYSNPQCHWWTAFPINTILLTWQAMPPRRITFSRASLSKTMVSTWWALSPWRSSNEHAEQSTPVSLMNYLFMTIFQVKLSYLQILSSRRPEQLTFGDPPVPLISGLSGSSSN